MIALRHIRTRLLPVLLVLAAFAVGAAAPHAQDPDRLRDRIDDGRQRERSLASAAQRLGRLERAAAREVAVLTGRLSEAQRELALAQARLQRTQTDLAKARRRVARLRSRLTEVRDKLSDLLRTRYVSGRPDLVTVVLEADGFNQLLESVDFLRRVQQRDTELLGLVRSARVDAGRQRRVFKRLERSRRTEAEAVGRRRDALASMQSVLMARRTALGRARAARLIALRGTRADRRRAERSLSRLLAERARAQRAVGPGGPWAIPWPIVQCESGGQNLPPNSAGASGYYQFLPSTWAGVGGSTRHAFQAPKAEQDRLAAQLWAGGSGAHNWVCAVLVGMA